MDFEKCSSCGVCFNIWWELELIIKKKIFSFFYHLLIW
jgi:hypothetical protein